MDIFAYAKKMEKDGEQYYRSLAKTSTDPGLSAVLNELADAEVKHFHILEQMEKLSGSLAPTEILKNAKNIFSSMKVRAGFGPGEIEAYRKALAIEKSSEDFYEQKAAESSNPQQAALFKQIAGEERKHYFLIDNMIEFMNRPNQWLENAEWNHLDEY